MITPASFKIRFTEYSTTADERIQLFIDDSILILNEAFWGEKYDLGLAYLTAHFLTIADKSAAGNIGSVGQVQSKAVDGTSVSFNSGISNSQQDAFYASTSYGQRYLTLRRTLGTVAYVI